MFNFLKNLFNRKPVLQKEVAEEVFNKVPVRIGDTEYSFNPETTKGRKHPRYSETEPKGVDND
jgi:hypothetical protein